MAGQFALARLDDMIAIRAQYLDIALRTRMSEHVQIHSRSHEHGSLGGKVSGYQHIVGDPMCHLAYRRGCGRSYQHSIRPETEIHMAVPCAIPSGEKFADDRPGCQSRESDGSNELLAGRSNDYLHFSPLLDEQAGQNGSLVGSDTPRDTKDDVLAGQR